MKTHPVEFAPCPHCGKQLLAALARDIANPSQPESCPTFKAPAKKVAVDLRQQTYRPNTSVLLATYAMLGAAFTEANS